MFLNSETKNITRADATRGKIGHTAFGLGQVAEYTMLDQLNKYL